MERLLDFPIFFGPEEKKEMGKNIHRYRKSVKHWTLDRLAEETEISLETISKHENGRQAIGLDNLIRYSLVFDCDLEDLLPESIKLRFSRVRRPEYQMLETLDEKKREHVLELIRILSGSVA